MSTYISGGCKNGKSHYALKAAKAHEGPYYYVATMIPRDEEDRARVLAHRREREGWGFVTLECARNLPECLEGADPRGAFLIDSVTALLSNEMFPNDGFNGNAAVEVATQLETFVRRAPNTVLVSDFIFSDAALYDETTEHYRRGLAFIDRHMARFCDNVIEVINAQCVVHKGRLPV